ncbi:MAG: hypothetical protein WEF86_04520 [Gemmatimonadota bacterium]
MRFMLLISLSSVAACGPRGGAGTATQDAEHAAIEVMAAVDPGMPLDEMLKLLDEYLANAQISGMESDGEEYFLRAEAVSDRLLQARMPFEWIPSEQYTLGSRLRQVQSTADRVLALLQTGAARPILLEEVEALRADVIDLRKTVAQGGAPAPPSIEALLAADSTRVAATASPQADPVTPTRPQPLGTPIRQ